VARTLFVTGTDTGVGKTVVAVTLLRALGRAGWRAVGMKPVASGIDDALGVNDDVAALMDAAGVVAPLAEVNPYAFRAPIAPHAAAQREGRPIDVDVIRAAAAALARRAEAIVVEGAGGALVPIDGTYDMLDIAVALHAPVLLVVGVRLGCVNHALLSAGAIRARGCALAGWVATRLDPSMDAPEASIEAISARLGAPPLADFATPASGAFGAGALSMLGFAPRA
jgi:dethiobiotin synthetase